MIFMKNVIFYLKLIIVILIISNSVCFTKLSKMSESVYCYYEKDSNFVLIEKNVISKSFVSHLYKDSNDNYISVIKDYLTNEEIKLNELIKEDKIEYYNSKIEELLYLKYPKYVADSLIKENVKKSYLFRDNELVIYFNEYSINPPVNEILYLKVNYNEIKDYLNFTVILDKEYKNESGYDYTNAKKSISITFDDSPNINKTNKILNYLKDFHYHATFFIVGEKAQNNKDLLINIKNSGNEIGSHTYNHMNMSKMKNEEIKEDYNKVNDLYNNLFNEDLKLFRPPYGIVKDNQLSLLNVSFIMWSMDTLDWKHRNSDYIVNYVINNIKDGDIILFHDSYDSTVYAIEKLLPLLYSNGYQVMSVSELAKVKNKQIEQNKIYYSFN